MTDKCTWIGIGVEIEKYTTFYSQCVKLNYKIATDSIESFKFSDTNRPHINLYDLDVPVNNLTRIKTDLETVLKGAKSFALGIKGMKSFRFGALYLEVEKHPLLIELHTKIVETVSRWKGNCICSDYLQPNRKYTLSQQKMLEQYGNPFVLNEFYPHITVGFVKDPQVFLKDLDKNLYEPTITEKIEINNVSVVSEAKKQHQIIYKFKLSR